MIARPASPHADAYRAHVAATKARLMAERQARQDAVDADLERLYPTLAPTRVYADGGPLPASRPPAHNVAQQFPPVTQIFFDWIDQGGKGAVKGTLENFRAMCRFYGISARSNVIKKRHDVTIPGKSFMLDDYNKAIIAELESVAIRNGFPQGQVSTYIGALAAETPHNPVTEWIESRPWDGRSRFADLCATVRVEAGYSTELRDKLLRRWLLSAVAAAAGAPGFEAHGAIVFTGPQGAGKTRWVKRLVPEDMRRDLILDGAIIDASNKDTLINALSHWIVELGELDATFRKSDIARLKAFITQPTDKIRRPYERAEDERQRRTVFCASVNDRDYLVDETGNRRFWTIAVISLDHNHDIDTQQLWAEVMTWYRAGEQWHLTAEENAALGSVNAEHQQRDPLEDLIRAAYRSDEPIVRFVPAATVLRELGYDKPTTGQARTASRVLKAMGFAQRKSGFLGFDMPNRVNRVDYSDGRPI